MTPGVVRSGGPGAPGAPAERAIDVLDPLAVRSMAVAAPADPLRLGPLEKVYLIWLGGGSCDGCTVAVTGSTHPRLEQLLAGSIPGLPRVELIHSDFSTESGTAWTHNLMLAARGELDAPYVLTWEGSVMDESLAGSGFWSGLGRDPETGDQMTSRQWLDRLAPGAAAVIAIGTCATWGGVPAARGNATGATGLGRHLGARYRSALGLPLINVPGCAPAGDGYMETVAGVLLFANRLAPAPDLDEMGRPARLFGGTVHDHCDRVKSFEQGIFAEEQGEAGCLVELGCWGPIVECNIAERGVIDGHGGCMSVGGACIGCTMPGFPDDFGVSRHPLAGSSPLGGTHRVPGGVLRRLRSSCSLPGAMARHTLRRSERGFYRRPGPAPMSTTGARPR